MGGRVGDTIFVGIEEVVVRNRMWLLWLRWGWTEGARWGWTERVRWAVRRRGVRRLRAWRRGMQGVRGVPEGTPMRKDGMRGLTGRRRSSTR